MVFSFLNSQPVIMIFRYPLEEASHLAMILCWNKTIAGFEKAEGESVKLSLKRIENLVRNRFMNKQWPLPFQPSFSIQFPT